MKDSFLALRRWLDKPPLTDWLGVFAALALFTALALPTLVSASAYFDEGYSAYLARFNPISTAIYTAFDVHPPLYYFVLHIWQLLVGTDIAHLRFLSVIFAWITVIFAYLLVRRWFGRQSAMLAIFLLVLSPLFIRYGTAMRMYTMALAVAFVATYVLLRATTEKAGKWWKIYTALVVIGMWTNYFTAFVWVTHALWVYLAHRHDRVLFLRARKAFIWALIFYIPWLPVLIVRYAVVQAYGFWIPPLSIETFASTITESIVFRSASDTLAWVAVGIIALISVVGLWSRNAIGRLDSKSLPAFNLIGLMSLVPIALLIIISLPPLRSAYTYRYVLVATISCTLLTAIILAHAKFKKYDWPLKAGVAILAFALLIVGANQTLANGNRSLDTNWQNRTKQIMERVHASGLPATIVDRSAYAYYVVRLYPADGYPVKVLYTTDDEMVRGATRPLVDHKDESITNFDGLNKVWLVGDNTTETAKPSGSGWVQKKAYYENDSYTNTLSEAAIYYERP